MGTYTITSACCGSNHIGIQAMENKRETGMNRNRTTSHRLL